jgi:hypothetical protein
MRFKLITLALALSCLPAVASAAVPLPAQGSAVTVEGRAHILRGAQGTYLIVDGYNNGVSNIVGFIPFGNDSSFPGLYRLEGRHVAMSGVLYWDGRPIIVLNERDQLRIARAMPPDL